MSGDISVRSTSYGVDNRDWLASRHGEDMTVGLTLDIALFTKNTHYPEGYVRSGQPLGRVTATGLYGPYDNSANDGREVCRYLLFSFVRAIDPNNGNTLAKVGGAGYLHGLVKESKLPVAIDSAGKADLSQITWI